MPKPGQPRFNHVALSVPADLLNEEGRRDLVAFYSEVLGWQEYASETIDRKRLVFGAYTIDQFVFISANDDPMRAPRMDHFGLGVATLEELDTYYQRAFDFRRRDDRVDVVDKQTEQHPGLSITNFYVGYLLPMMLEVQYFAFD
jgi:catechol 2,3-dioxygenase-like lactoylglutathione lyase family enzyme